MPTSLRNGLFFVVLSGEGPQPALVKVEAFDRDGALLGEIVRPEPASAGG